MGNSIFLKRIQVTKLFNKFTYDINLENGYNVAILIGPNGFGKTTIFNLVDFIFKPNVSKFKKISIIPFENCICTLSNGNKIELESRNTKKSKRKKNEKLSKQPLYDIRSEIELASSESEEKTIFLKIIDGKTNPPLMNISAQIEEAIKFINDIDESPFIPIPDYILERYMEDMDCDEFLLRDIPPRYRMPLTKLSIQFNNISKFIEKYNCKFDINFISADRLYKQNIPFKIRENYGAIYSRVYDRRELNNPLFVIQERVKYLYNKTDAEYKKLVSEARDKLPKMFLNTHNKTKMTFDEFKKSWEEYVNDMEKYYELGLLESNQTIIEKSELEKSFKDNGAFLSVYLEAFKSTLEPWNKQYKKMKLFADILNKRNKISGKILKYGVTGLIIHVEERYIPLECLSSGEKNDLIMFYNLIFNSENGGLVMIDEPEISLHIEWQEEYIDWLLKICEMNKLQAIVATHSPNIVNGHFELYADRGLENESK